MAVISLYSGRKPQLDNRIAPITITGLAASAITNGAMCKFGASGTATLSSNTETDGMALETVGASQAVTLVQFGVVVGFDVSGMTVGDFVYTTQSDGLLNTLATSAIKVGKVIPSAVEESGKAIWLNCLEAAL